MYTVRFASDALFYSGLLGRISRWSTYDRFSKKIKCVARSSRDVPHYKFGRHTAEPLDGSNTTQRLRTA